MKVWMSNGPIFARGPPFDRLAPKADVCGRFRPQPGGAAHDLNRRSHCSAHGGERETLTAVCPTIDLLIVFSDPVYYLP
jgi:hypothetical protein